MVLVKCQLGSADMCSKTIDITILTKSIHNIDNTDYWKNMRGKIHVKLREGDD